MGRRKEIHDLLLLTPGEVITRAGTHVAVCDGLDELHRRFAEDIFSEIRSRNTDALPTRLILPVGPTGQYPYLVEALNQSGTSLANCWFFFMDEYCGSDGEAIPEDHPLSFRGEASRLLLDRLDPRLGLARERVFFPDGRNVRGLAAAIRRAGGIDTCYGGVGIHGHVAFNEPERGVAASDPRKVVLNDFTVAINAIRASVGGNLVGFPRHAFTLGMRQILESRKIRLYCRNGCQLDWANTVLRLALLGTPGEDFPVTLIRGLDYVICTDRETLASPRRVLQL